MSRSIQAGDFVDISLGDNKGRYIIKEIILPYIRIFAEGDPSILSALIATPQGWKVFGAEQIPYQIIFSAAPLLEEEAANICTNLILRRSELDESTLSKMQLFTQARNLPMITRKEEDIRTVCDAILRDTITKIKPDLKIDTLGTQNLARQYDKIVREREETARREEELRRIEENNRRRYNLVVLINRTKKQILLDENNQLKAKYRGQNICLNVPRLRNVSLTPLINENLKGRRASIPLRYWRQIFVAPTMLSENPEIQQRYFNLTEQLPVNLSNEDIINILGEENILGIINSLGSNRQIYLKLQLNELLAYVLITEFHEDNDIIQISPLTAFELNDTQQMVAIEDCILDTVASISLKLLRSLEVPEVDDALIKAGLIDRFSELGLLVVGDLLPIDIEGTRLIYHIEKLITSSGTEVYAAAIPAVASDVNVEIQVETKEELLEKLRAKITIEPIDEDLV